MEHRRNSSSKEIFSILRDQSGRLYEIPIMIAFMFIVISIGIPQFKKYGIKGPVVLLLEIAAGIAVLWGLLVVYDRVVMTSKVLTLIVEYFFGITVRIFFTGFGVLICDGFLFVIYPDLKTHGIVLGVEGVVLLAWSVWHTYHRRHLKPKTVAAPPSAPAD